MGARRVGRDDVVRRAGRVEEILRRPLFVKEIRRGNRVGQALL